MANDTCSQMLKVCAMRMLRLDDIGAVLAGASSMYVYEAPVTFEYKEVRPARERFEKTNGCGDTCALYIGPAKAVDSVDLKTGLCNLDAEIQEMMLGGSIITDVGYGTYGYKAATDSTKNVNGVAIETWAIQWKGRQRATLNGAPAWYRHVFPLTHWEQDNVQQTNDFSTIPLIGTGEVNDNYDTGLASDPLPIVCDAPYMWFIDDSKPAGACGYQAVA